MYFISVFFVLLVATFVKSGSCDATTEANLLALVTSGELLAPKHLTEKIATDLKAIRNAYPEVNNIVFTPPWAPGVLLAKFDEEQLKQIRIKYGEVTSSPLSGDYKILRFTTQYNPEVLAKILTSKSLVESAEPDNIIGGGSSIKYDSQNAVYTFIRGWGDCPSGCINKHYWEFKVSGPNQVKLLSEHGSPLESVAS